MGLVELAEYLSAIEPRLRGRGRGDCHEVGDSHAVEILDGETVGDGTDWILSFRVLDLPGQILAQNFHHSEVRGLSVGDRIRLRLIPSRVTKDRVRWAIEREGKGEADA